MPLVSDRGQAVGFVGEEGLKANMGCYFVLMMYDEAVPLTICLSCWSIQGLSGKTSPRYKQTHLMKEPTFHGVKV